MSDLNQIINLHDKRLRVLETKATPVNILPDIIEFDDLSSQFDNYTSRFILSFNTETQSVLNPYRLIVVVNGIIQSVSFPDYVSHSPLQKDGFYIDYEGYIVFAEAPPIGSVCNIRLMSGPTTNAVSKIYPLKPANILLGA
jgi:hypothetical protein